MDRELSAFLNEFPGLHLGGQEDSHNKRRKYLKVFRIHQIPKDKVHPCVQTDIICISGML